MSNDPLDSNLRDLVAETAEEMAVETKELADGLDEVVNTADGDPCSSYEWSIIFILIMVCSLFVMFLHLWTLFKRRSELSAFDILTLAFIVANFIQLGPMLAQVLHSGHNLYHFTQTSCKLQFYTDYGMRHVVAFLAISFFMYAYLILFHHFDPENLDGKMRRNYPWLIIIMAVIEGLFGMVPAMYIDVFPNFATCHWTPTMNLSNAQVLSMEITLRPITPYIIPAIVLLYPLFKVTKTFQTMEENKVKSTLFCILVITWGYIVMNLPYAVFLIYEYWAMLSGNVRMVASSASCNLKWVVFLVHQAWFLLVPGAIISHEIERGNKPVGAEITMNVWEKVKKEVDTRVTRLK